jgi:hypothetical protein
MSYLVSPIFFSAWMFKLLAEGAFPPNADSIGIPIAGFIMLWVVFLPLFIVGCYIFELFGRNIASR